MVIRAGEISWARHAACMRKMGNSCNIWLGILNARDYLSDGGTDGRIIL
jgi:hypothetical protein